MDAVGHGEQDGCGEIGEVAPVDRGSDVPAELCEAQRRVGCLDPGDLVPRLSHHRFLVVLDHPATDRGDHPVAGVLVERAEPPWC